MKPHFDLSDSSLLIVDDQPDNLRLVADFLEEYGADVMLGHDGTDGLTKARLGRPDLILLDVMMPGMDGFEVCRHLKQDPETRDIPVIFLTALHEVEDKVRGFQAGGVDYLTKPLQELEVIARVDVHLKLCRALQRAEAASRAKSRFLANMNHEIRTPINAVLGYATLLEQSDPDPRQLSHLAAIRKAGSTLMTLINGVLDLSRLESGRLQLQPAPVHLQEVLNDLETLFRAEAINKGVALDLKCVSPSPPSLMLDGLRLRQILINLLGNAFKFTHKGEVEVRAQCKPGDGEWVDLRVSVRDTGIGIAPEQQQRIFEAFTQQEGQSQVEYGGTGLGLAISRQLADLMGGKLEVSSVPGGGSTFTLRLNALKATSDVEKPAASPGAYYFEPARLLVADDDISSRLLMVEFLTREGFDVETAENGEQAVQAARERRPDLILMDHNMPLLQGDEAACLLAGDADTAGIPVILVSATDENQLYSTVRDCIADYLPKPYTRTELLDMLAGHLSSHSAESPPPPSRSVDVEQALVLSEAEQAFFAGFPEYPSVNQVLELAGLFGKSRNPSVRRLGERLSAVAGEFNPLAIRDILSEIGTRGDGEIFGVAGGSLKKTG